MQEKSDTPSVKGKNYADFSRDELIAEINRLKKTKKYGLVWEHKKEEVIEDFKAGQQPYLKEVEDKRIENAPGEPTNLIIEGDNFDALSVLNYTHAGKIDVIYIDPPYNTGNKDFIYNDNYVDSEDAFRHSKWLSFMEPRLKLANGLLSESGIILISINDNELATVRLLCDSIFGQDNFVENFIWVKNSGGSLSKTTLTRHEYVLCYAKNKESVLDSSFFFMEKPGYYDVNNLIAKMRRKGVGLSEATKELRKYYLAHSELKGISLYGNIDKDWRIFRCLPITAPNNNFYDVIHPKTGKPVKTPPRGWSWSKETMAQKIKEGRVVFGKDENSVPAQKLYLEEAKYEHKRSTINSDQAEGNKVLATALGANNGFRNSNPKPLSLLFYLLQNTDKEITILDFFAGSGTTGQAVLELNKEDGGHRQFILCTNNGDKGPDSTKIAEEITYPRIKTVITGKRQDGSKYSNGIPANLRYYKIKHEQKLGSNDANRLEMSKHMEDILQIKENAFEEVKTGRAYKLYKNSEKYLCLALDAFEMEKIIEKITEENREKLDTVIYSFSYSRDAFEDDYEADFNIEFKAMPEGLLKTYLNITESLRSED